MAHGTNIDRSGLLDALTQGVAELADSDRWQAHLDVQGQFRRYSFNNALLIGAQRPDATRVAGFAAWKKLGRTVVRGEKAIWILAPMVGRRTRTDGGEEKRPIYGFRPVAVFDQGQTEGDDLPEACRNIEGDAPAAYREGLIRLAAQIGYSVEYAELPGTRNGDCSYDLRRIRVESRNQPSHQVKTLVHELAHAMLHQGQGDRALSELEAESTAYIVCRSLGLDSGEYSFGYVAVWAGGGPEAVARITSSGGIIQRTAGIILDSLELPDAVDPADMHQSRSVEAA